MNLVLRDARPEDAPHLVQLIAELAEYEKLADQARATAEDLRTALFGARPAAEALVAEVDGEPVGFALWFTTFSTFVGKPGLYVEDVYIRPAHRGRGIGKAIFRRLAQAAVERGFGRMEWSVLDWNEPAIAFYRSLGAEPMSEWTVQRLSGDALRQVASGSSGSAGEGPV